MNACSSAPLSLVDRDPLLEPYRGAIAERRRRFEQTAARLVGGQASLAAFAAGHHAYGLHRDGDGWVMREWAPNATAIFLIGAFNGWIEHDAQALRRVDAQGNWELRLDGAALRHGDLYRLTIHWQGGRGDRLPAYARRVVQDPVTQIFNAQVWAPAQPYAWRRPSPPRPDPLLIYEAHVGMALECGRVGTYDEFRVAVLPRIVAAGYNAIQLMAVMEHPYYGSFGYHVANFFAASSRFGTPEALKALVDAIHEAGLIVIMDLVHSHAVRNEVEGLSRFDGTAYQFFHAGARGYHEAWDSRCFDYGKIAVLHFLLSNCRFWMEEYRIDGFRFDGVTSMLYLHHGLGAAFDHYARYFDERVDPDAWTYLALANRLIHDIHPDAVTVAEDVSGMPGLAAPIAEGGCGFDFRLAMGVPDCWQRLLAGTPDEAWSMQYLWHELTNRRAEEKTIGYAESHDQALVGGKTVSFLLMDAGMYAHMRVGDPDPAVDRGMALHKMIRLITLATAGHGYLNFMGNEFGHPEWIDFPRDGNGWSYHYARRQWRLRDDPDLKYRFLADFDVAMLDLIKATHALGHAEPRRLLVHEDDNILAFERNAFYFVFNFHPTRSHAVYPIEVLPGVYRSVLDTDDARFGGHHRRIPGYDHVTRPHREGRVLRHCMEPYLPARTALVLKKLALSPQPGLR